MNVKSLLAPITSFHRGMGLVVGYEVFPRSSLRFLLLGVLIDWTLVLVLRGLEVPLATAHILGFLASTLILVLHHLRVLPSRSGFPLRHLVVCLLALGLRGAIVRCGLDLGIPESFAWGPAAIASVLMTWLGLRLYVPYDTCWSVASDRWRLAVVGAVAYMVLLRLLYGVSFELLPEESYYWLYAQHLDIGYFDHPPLTAWTIAVGTAIFGDNAFGVRIGALAWWVVATIAMAQLTRELVDSKSAWLVVLLMAILPYFTSAGILMFPEAPLVACWAMALFFLQRALIGNKPRAWIGVGVAIGLGMLAKYTIALLVPATVMYCLINRDSRRWFVHPGPYLALLISALLFSPVVVWNIQHEWMSFRFQTTGRWQGNATFSVHVLLESMFALLGPTTFAAGLWWARNRWRNAPAACFIAVFVLVPLSIFVVYAFRHPPRLNWTGPLWLILLPAVATTMVHGPRWLTRLWPPTITISLIIYAVFLHYVVLGIPGVSYPSRMTRLTGSEDLASRILHLVNAEHVQSSSQPPVVTCLNKYWLASNLSFNLHRLDPELEVTSQQLFGRRALMFDLWHPPEEFIGRDLLVISGDAKDLTSKSLGTYGTIMGAAKEIPVHAPNGLRLGTYWYAMLRGYAPPGAAAAGAHLGTELGPRN